MASLDMALDDIIKTRRGSERGRGQGRPRRGGRGGYGGGGGRGGFGGGGGRGRFGGGGRMVGPPRRAAQLGLNGRPTSFTIAKTVRRNKSLPWQRDLFEESLRAAGLPAIATGGKLHVTNLDVGVTNEDIRELFSEIGELKKYAIHYGKTGRPSGSAEVVYVRRGDAFKAISRYNNVQLDGKPMKVEVVGANSELPISARINVVPGVPRRAVVMTRGGGRGGRGSGALNRVSGQKIRGGIKNGRVSGRIGDVRGRGRGRGGRGGRGGGGKKKNVDKSADELDKELETYHATAMES